MYRWRITEVGGSSVCSVGQINFYGHVALPPNPLPHLTLPSAYWDNFNNRGVATGTAFSSVYNIDTIYQPVAFTNAVDLTDENAVKTFFETYGTSVPSITTETPLNQYAVYQTGEVALTKAYEALTGEFMYQ